MEQFTPMNVLLIGAAWIVLHWLLSEGPVNINIGNSIEEHDDAT